MGEILVRESFLMGFMFVTNFMKIQGVLICYKMTLSYHTSEFCYKIPSNYTHIMPQFYLYWSM